MVISSDNDDFKELEISLRECGMKKTEDYMVRSGSAPPTVEGSLSAVGGFFSQDGDDALSGYSSVLNGKICMTEEELMSNPNYLSYYYSKANRNPRLPSPLISKEDWLSAQRFQNARSGFGGIGDRRKVQQQQQSDMNSLFSTQPVFNPQKEESVYGSRNAEWGGDGLIHLSEIGIDGRKNSSPDFFQDDVGHATPISTHPSRPASRNAFDGGFDKADAAEAQLSQQHKYVADGQGISGVKNTSASAFDTFDSVVGRSLSRSASPDPQLVVRTPSPRLPPIGEGKVGSSGTRSVNDSDSINGVSSNMNGPTNLVSALSGMSLSRGPEVNEENHLQSQIQQEIANHQNFLFNMHGGQNQIGQHPNLGKSDSGHLPLPFAAQTELRETYLKSHSSPILTNSRSFPHYQSADNTNSAITNDGLNVLPINPTMLSMASQIDADSLPPPIEKVVAAPVLNSRAFARGLRPVDSFGGTADLQNLKRMGYNKHSMDELYLQYLRTSHYAAQFAAFADPSMDGNYTGNSYTDMLSLRNAYTGALLPEKSQFGVPYIGKSSGMNQGYYDNPSFGLGGMSYSGYPFATPILPNSLVGPRSPVMHSEWNTHFASGIRNSGSVMGSWHSKAGGRIVDTFASTLLEEFKDKSRSFALSEISGHVVEFSTDQYGSRFIQQKLGTASLAEKNMVFQEIIPHAFSLMTDVFGNYVIQKYFEHGSTTQRRKLANKLTGHVLQLSLQMYGCRVIQKAIEVLDLDQQTKMVAELDGNVMRCVGDQNGNHVIQKCIECIPQDAIQFIISSFYDQVVTLSTHPYGCRVIQRVLEHCNDSKTQHIMMDEIFQSVCMLAQDQYGNYVVQHILKFGKPHERSAVIKKLAGQIVQMSQHKFASNVVEKCLTYGSPLECQTLVNEMLGTTDENEPLQAMMKDQFGNYVVQKVLETCDDQQRERILSRIKVHLDALKKYTYGKHIVARVEKLVQAGERRIALQSPSLSS